MTEWITAFICALLSGIYMELRRCREELRDIRVRAENTNLYLRSQTESTEATNMRLGEILMRLDNGKGTNVTDEVQRLFKDHPTSL